MPLENYEDFLELSVKQFAIQSILSSLGKIMCGVRKTNTNVVSSKVSLVFFVSN